MIKVRSLDHFVLRVRDLDKSLAFYHDLLGLEILFLKEYKANERPFVSARIGESLIDLVPDPTYDPDTGKMAGGYMHCCVEVENNLTELIPFLKSRGIAMIDDQPVPRMGARGMGLSIYVLDPDGYVVELKEANA
jgi:catechol 2,3-dioxygenase-like lactoylglutathione lyase family enzyme